MIVHIENHIDSMKKLINLISEFGKTARYKVNIQKSMEFLYTNNKISGAEIRNKYHTYCSKKKNKVPRNKLN